MALACFQYFSLLLKPSSPSFLKSISFHSSQLFQSFFVAVRDQAWAMVHRPEELCFGGPPHSVHLHRLHDLRHILTFSSFLEERNGFSALIALGAHSSFDWTVPVRQPSLSHHLSLSCQLAWRDGILILTSNNAKFHNARIKPSSHKTSTSAPPRPSTRESVNPQPLSLGRSRPHRPPVPHPPVPHPSTIFQP